MKLSAEDIEEFKTIYRKEYGVELSDSDAEEQAQRLLRFFKAIMRAVSNQQERSSVTCDD